MGPATWAPVAGELVGRGHRALVPSLLGVAAAPPPQWRHVVEEVRAATAEVEEPIVLVGHSGAGPLLPSVADTLSGDVAALVFVDAFLPPPEGAMPLAPPPFREQLRALAIDGLLPPWSSWFGPDAMRDLVPDEHLRAALEAEMPRMPLSYYEAAVTVPDGWADRACAYLLLSEDPYRAAAEDARERGWPVATIPGADHLAIATKPEAVTEALLAVTPAS